MHSKEIKAKAVQLHIEASQMYLEVGQDAKTLQYVYLAECKAYAKALEAYRKLEREHREVLCRLVNA